ncbi:hypothetical protein ACHHYP_13330 [Achlya hypogyna]|uniref:Uncharacterized protein n=1 Tax=Achlya hypogyna TaxID=1202772 RepID=A0A1V9YFG0_ACHHY|nr:hypothetical protein ACHHYP_13330 [Achlya hypogyna]
MPANSTAWEAAVAEGDTATMRTLLYDDDSEAPAYGYTQVLEAKSGATVDRLRRLRTMTRIVKGHRSGLLDEILVDGGAALHSAVRKGHTDAVALLLHAGADPNCLDGNLWSPVYAAAANPRRWAVLTLLLQFGADLHCLQNGETPLHRATKAGHASLVELFLRFGSSPNMLDKESLWFGLADATNYVAALLLQYGANTNVFNSRGATLLQVAITSGDDAMARLLLRSGADCNLRDAKGQTSLHVAVACGQHGLVQYMLASHQANPNLLDKISMGHSSLQVAIYRDDTRMVELLLGHGGLSQQTRLAGLRTAMELHAVAVARLIVANHQRLRNKAGQTAMHFASVYCSDGAMVDMLLDMGVAINAQDDMGFTPLMYTGQRSQPELFRLLMTKGAVMLSWPIVAADQSKYHTAVWPWLLECPAAAIADLATQLRPLLQVQSPVSTTGTNDAYATDVLVLLTYNAFPCGILALVDACLRRRQCRLQASEIICAWALGQQHCYLAKCFWDLGCR